MAVMMVTATNAARMPLSSNRFSCRQDDDRDDAAEWARWPNGSVLYHALFGDRH